MTCDKWIASRWVKMRAVSWNAAVSFACKVWYCRSWSAALWNAFNILNDWLMRHNVAKPLVHNSLVRIYPIQVILFYALWSRTYHRMFFQLDRTRHDIVHLMNDRIFFLRFQLEIVIVKIILNWVSISWRCFFAGLVVNLGRYSWGPDNSCFWPHFLL